MTDCLDAYGRCGKISVCEECGGRGTDHAETCLRCGGFGWVRAGTKIVRNEATAKARFGNKFITPWEFLEEDRTEEPQNTEHPLTITDGNGDDLAQIFSSDDSDVSISREQAIANARLIASAPSLREALETIAGGFINCSFVMSNPPDWHSAFTQLQAIAAWPWNERKPSNLSEQ